MPESQIRRKTGPSVMPAAASQAAYLFFFKALHALNYGFELVSRDSSNLMVPIL
jgi:hypothetical protein